MKEQKYRIIFKGEVLPDTNLETVKQKLAAFYKDDIKQAKPLFSGKRYVLKENTTLDYALFAAVLRKWGNELAANARSKFYLQAKQIK